MNPPDDLGLPTDYDNACNLLKAIDECGERINGDWLRAGQSDLANHAGFNVHYFAHVRDFCLRHQWIAVDMRFTPHHYRLTPEAVKIIETRWPRYERAPLRLVPPVAA